MFKIIKNIFRSIKFFFQKLCFGFSDRETWNLDITCSQLILPRLKRFKQLTNGYPCELSYEEWMSILDKMIYSFEFYATEKIFDLTMDQAEENNKVEEGIQLFAKYFNHLWW